MTTRLHLRLLLTPRFYRLPYVQSTDWGYDPPFVHVYQATWGWLNLQLHVPVERKEWRRGWGWPDFWGRHASFWRKVWGRQELDHASW